MPVLNVYFYYADRHLPLQNKIKIRRFIQSIFILEKTIIHSIKYIFCSDEYLLDINRIFLHHDFYTDIVSFNLSDSQKPVEGEIYISIDRVKENAFSLKIEREEELLRVIIHGALHLCGYKDKTKKESYLMRTMENKYLNLFKKISFDSI
jgi:probable rRNA maturation factor